MKVDSPISAEVVRSVLASLTHPYDATHPAMAYHWVHLERYAQTINALAKLKCDGKGRTLELAAAPFGMSAILRAMMFEDLKLANYAEGAVHGEVTIGVEGKLFRLEEYGFNAECEPWPIGEGMFDLIIACEIVEHLAIDPMALFTGANKALSLGGRLFVSTPNAASLQNFFKLARLMPAGLAPHFRRPVSLERVYERHNREYSPFTLGAMFEAAGFEVELMETVSSYPLDTMGFSAAETSNLLALIGIPELRRDTINICGIKRGPVRSRYPTTHELYLASDL